MILIASAQRHLVLGLLDLVFGQRIREKLRDRDRSRAIAFCLFELQATRFRLLQGSTNGKKSVVQFDVLPTERKNFAAAHARSNGQQDWYVQSGPLRCLDQPYGLRLVDGFDFHLLGPWRLDSVRDVSGDETPPHGAVERLPEHPMMMNHSLSRKAPVATVFSTVFESGGVVCLYVKG